MQMRSTPCAISASASLSFAAQMPMAPAASCIFAMSALLWVLACGRVARPKRFTAVCILAMLRSSRSRSTHSAGVSRSHFEMPMAAWLPVSRAATSDAEYPLTGRGTQTCAASAAEAERNARREAE